MKVHYIPGVGYDSNVYLLEDEDPVLVDTGTGMYADTVLEEVSRLVPLRKIRRIVLTHCHYDHIGGAAAFQKATGARIHLHEAEAEPMMSGDMSLTISQMFGSRLASMDIAPLKEGDTLDCGESELKVLHTPGHSPGSIALHDKKNKASIVGDTVFCDGGVGRWDLPGGDLASLKRSIDRLKKLELKSMYPGHGPYAEGDAGQHMKLASRYIEEAY